MYETGSGVSQNFGRALELYEQAAQQGYALAENNLGRMFETGKGIARDPKLAVTWYTKSARQGDATGEFDLGSMYWHGSGVPQRLRQGGRMVHVGR
jgi:uncharacterized protein